MKIDCYIIDDLLPLYIDGGCSEKSGKLLEEHLEGCACCREKMRRMQSGEFDPLNKKANSCQVVDYAKKVKRRRARAGILITVGAVITAVLLSLVVLTVIDMRRQMSPTVYPTETGVYNLSAEELNTTSDDANQYVLFTNSTKIKVNLLTENAQSGYVTLWDASDNSGYIQICIVDGTTSECTFGGLTSSRRYKVVCDGLDDVPVIISEGRTVSFFNSLSSVLSEIIDMLGLH